MARTALLLSLCVGVTAFAFSVSRGADLTVEITDAQGRPVPDAVVVATPEGMHASDVPLPVKPAVMDQVDKLFVPRVLVVRTGQSVIFPNSDSVAHQVYSFSSTKRFELPLYRGQVHPPVTLDRPGLIVLGCNIHDGMVGYIYVTDSPFAGATDARGIWKATGLQPGPVDLVVWSARLPRDAAQTTQQVTLSESIPALAHVKLKDVLRPPPPVQDARIRDY